MLLRNEKIDWWIPVSHTNTAIIDTIIKEELVMEESRVKVMGINSRELVEMLDDKIMFLEEARKLGLSVPDFFTISSSHDVVKLCRQGSIKYPQLSSMIHHKSLVSKTY